MPLRPTRTCGIIGLCSLLSMAALCGASRAVDPSPEALRFFENRVRPLLATHCQKCHGAKKSESDLRLDSREALLAGGTSGPAVALTNPSASLLLEVVRYDGDIQMPPGGRLQAAEVRVFERWVAMGAPWTPTAAPQGGPRLRRGPITAKEREFWSFQPLLTRKPPRAGGSWAQTPVDRFIARRLAAEGIRPAKDAERRTWLRRLWWDLLGLPPSPAELRRFLDDSSPDAAARAVDRALASPRYGARWGRHWLDVVRYADTAGETADYPVPQAWRYRNYVIEAFNADLPYDRFLREQIAGDLAARQLADRHAKQWTAAHQRAYQRQLTATGFLAVSRRYGFGTDQYLYLTLQDSIDTLGQAVLGLTLGCARCHDHKYDPITTADYYALYGILSSSQYSLSGDEKNKRPRQLVPSVPPALATRRKAAFDRRLGALDARLKKVKARRETLQARVKQLAAHLANSKKPALQPDRPTQEQPRRQLQPPGSEKKGFRFPHAQALRMLLLRKADRDADGNTGVMAWRDPSSLPVVVVNSTQRVLKIPGTMPPRTLAVHPAMADGVSIAWRSPFRGRVRIRGRVIDAHDCGNGVQWYLDLLNATGGEELGRGVVTRNARQALTVAGSDSKGVAVETGDFLRLGILPNKSYGCDLTRIEWEIAEVGGAKRTWNLLRDVVPDLLAGGKGNPHADSLGNPEVWFFCRLPALRETVPPIHLASGDAPAKLVRMKAELLTLEAEQQKLAGERAAMVARPPYLRLYAVVEGKPQDSPIHKRGDPLRPGKIVPRRNLEILGGQPVGQGSGRQQLAKWITDPRNPLTARVLVNRVWHYHFGRGLVATPNDFGVRGRRPSHPELLDWLAAELLRSNWSLKRLHRVILTSRTYRLSSAAPVTGESSRTRLRRLDLFGQYRRRRLEAEAIRDGMLQLSGSLDHSMGAGHPFPPENQWSFTQHAPFYAVYPSDRRSVYLMTQRLKRHPFLGLFDGADPNASTPARTETTVATQALYLMNSPFVHRQAERFADRIRAEVKEDEAAGIGRLYLEALSREPSASERTAARTFLSGYRQRLMTLGQAPPAAQRQALAALTRTLLVRNEFLFIE